MLDCLIDHAADAIPLTPVTRDGLAALAGTMPPPHAAWIAATGFDASPGRTLSLPGTDGRVARVLVGVEADDPWAFGDLPRSLAAASYQVMGGADTPNLDERGATRAALAWALGCYRFTRYRKDDKPLARLVWPDRADRAAVARAASAAALARDLVNTPASDLGPAELADAAERLAGEFGARIRVVTGDDLLRKNYPAIHAVGKGSPRAPRLIDLVWGDANHPKVTLVGKGVCFDTGGLDLKPSASMLLMKKDMGGAATVLGIARMVMMAGLPVRLRVLIPAVENSVSGEAFRPSDVLATRKGLTVEVGNTDAEGRLVLCDALAEADSEAPDLILDMATLTGAARVALGPDLPALFANDERLAADLLAAAQAEADPLWRLPLWQPYRKGLDSKVADTNNISSGGFAGAIVAALFLERFVSPGRAWAHIDTFAWNPSSRPGRPEGGEALGMRAVFAMLQARYGTGAQTRHGAGAPK